MMQSNNPDRAAAFAARYGWTLLVLLGFAFYACYLLFAVPESPRMQVFLRLIPWLIIPYLVWGSIYAAFWADRYSTGPARNRWLWWAGTVTLTLGLGLGFPGLVSDLFHYQGLTVFGGPAFLFFMAPVLAIFLFRLFDNLLGSPISRVIEIILLIILSRRNGGRTTQTTYWNLPGDAFPNKYPGLRIKIGQRFVGIVPYCL